MWTLVFVLSIWKVGVTVDHIDGFKSQATCLEAQHELLKLKNVDGFDRQASTYVAIACVEKK